MLIRRGAIVELLDRPVIRDPEFRAAVAAIHADDVPALERIVEDEPRLLHERIREPDCYRDAPREQYFLDPQLPWFVADNPHLVETMPAKHRRGHAGAARARRRTGVDFTLEL